MAIGITRAYVTVNTWVSSQCFLSPSASSLHFLELFKFKGRRTFLFDLSKQVIQVTCSSWESSDGCDPSLIHTVSM